MYIYDVKYLLEECIIQYKLGHAGFFTEMVFNHLKAKYPEYQFTYVEIPKHLHTTEAWIDLFKPAISLETSPPVATNPYNPTAEDTHPFHPGYDAAIVFAIP